MDEMQVRYMSMLTTLEHIEPFQICVKRLIVISCRCESNTRIIITINSMRMNHWPSFVHHIRILSHRTFYYIHVGKDNTTHSIANSKWNGNENRKRDLFFRWCEKVELNTHSFNWSDCPMYHPKSPKKTHSFLCYSFRVIIIIVVVVNDIVNSNISHDTANDKQLCVPESRHQINSLSLNGNFSFISFRSFFSMPSKIEEKTWIWKIFGIISISHQHSSLIILFQNEKAHFGWEISLQWKRNERNYVENTYDWHFKWKMMEFKISLEFPKFG